MSKSKQAELELIVLRIVPYFGFDRIHLYYPHLNIHKKLLHVQEAFLLAQQGKMTLEIHPFAAAIFLQATFPHALQNTKLLEGAGSCSKKGKLLDWQSSSHITRSKFLDLPVSTFTSEMLLSFLHILFIFIYLFIPMYIPHFLPH